jgi:hypothetical protein
MNWNVKGIGRGPYTGNNYRSNCLEIKHKNNVSQPVSMLRFVLETSLTIIFFLVSLGGVRLSPLGTSANIWTIVPAPDDR